MSFSRHIFTNSPRPPWVRLAYWIHIGACALLLLSGWVLCGVDLTSKAEILGRASVKGRLATALQWHFSALWILIANGLVVVTCLLATRQLRNCCLPLNFLSFRVRNSVSGQWFSCVDDQNPTLRGLGYGAVIGVLTVEVASGYALVQSTQLHWISRFFGGYDSAYKAHFWATIFLVTFVAGKVVFAMYLSRSAHDQDGV